MKQWSIITFYFNYFFLFLMSKKSFLENKVFSSIGVGGSLRSLANIKCVAANITRSAAIILHGLAIILRCMTSICSSMHDILRNYFDIWERTHCENMFTCYYFFTWYKTGCSL